MEIFPRVDAFFVWGFPFETLEDFHQSLFQMVSFRMIGARILPSLLSLLPQTEIYREWAGRAELEFCPYLLPEFVFTGHEVCRGGCIELPERYGEYFELITKNPGHLSGLLPHRPGGQRAAEAGLAPPVRLLSGAGAGGRHARRAAGPIRRTSSRRSWPRGREDKRPDPRCPPRSLLPWTIRL